MPVLSTEERTDEQEGEQSFDASDERGCGAGGGRGKKGGRGAAGGEGVRRGGKRRQGRDGEERGTATITTRNQVSNFFSSDYAVTFYMSGDLKDIYYSIQNSFFFRSN